MMKLIFVVSGFRSKKFRLNSNSSPDHDYGFTDTIEANVNNDLEDKINLVVEDPKALIDLIKV